MSQLFFFICFVMVMIFTRSVFNGDSTWYVLDIKNSLGHGWTEYPKLWDFSHVLWRPLGKILTTVFLPLIQSHFQNNSSTAISFLFISLNVLAALVCGLVIQKASWKLTHNARAATLAAVAFIGTSAMLNYSRSASSYVFGLAFISAAFYITGFYQGRSWKAAVLCGFLLSIAVLSWIPYVVTIPAVLLAGPILNGEDRLLSRTNLRFWLFTVLSAVIMGVGYYALAIGCRHLHTLPELLQWIQETSHNPERTHKLMRMATGMPRSIYELGDTARWIKWYVFRDPYAHVGLMELLRVAFVKLALFYLTLASLAWALWRSPMGRRLLLWIVIAMIPNIGMALLYESGSPERYLPFLPMIFIGFGYVLGSQEFKPMTRLVLALLCCAHLPVNWRMLSAATVDRRFDNAANSIADLTTLPAESHLFVINGFDDRALLLLVAPFHPINQKSVPAIDSIVSSLGPHVPLWRSEFAAEVLRTWDRSGEVWVTTRVLAAQPQRNWAWVEGDDRRITWQEIYSFFRAFDPRETRGGADGFFHLRDTPQNRRLLHA